MIYIKTAGDGHIILGGPVATQAMLDDGWEEYNGDVPSLTEGQLHKLVGGVLEAYTPEVSPLTQVQIYKDYLASTDFKMLAGYVPKEGEDLTSIKKQRNVARQYIRDNDTTRKELNATPTANTLVQG